MSTLGDGPIDPKYRQQMNVLARDLDRAFNGRGPRQTGFVLLVFPFGEGEGDRCNYISNADRADVVTLMKEQIARFEHRMAPETKA